MINWKQAALGAVAAAAVYYLVKKFGKSDYVIIPPTPDLRPKYKGSWQVLDDNRTLKQSILDGKTLLARAAYGYNEVEAWLAKTGLPPITADMQATAIKHIKTFQGENLQAEPTYVLYQKVGTTDFFLCAKSVLGSTGEELPGGVPVENLEDVNLWFYLYAEVA